MKSLNRKLQMPMTRSIPLPISGAASAYLHPANNILTHARTVVPKKHMHAQQQFGCSSKWPWLYILSATHVSLLHLLSKSPQFKIHVSITWERPSPWWKNITRNSHQTPHFCLKSWRRAWSSQADLLNWEWCAHAHVSKSATSSSGNYNM